MSTLTTEQLGYQKTLDAFINSEDFNQGIIDATKAGFSGSGYSVELFPGGTWRVLWENEIGNLYQTPGIILALPKFSDEDWAAFEDAEDEPWDYEGELADELRDRFQFYISQAPSAHA